MKKVQKSLKYDGLFMSTTYQMCMTDKKQEKSVCVGEFTKLLVSSQQRRLQEVERI